eukprot:6226796-Pyramimonas_sp.AAC.1
MSGCPGRRGNFAFLRDRQKLEHSLVFARLSSGPSFLRCRRCGAYSTERLNHKLGQVCLGRTCSATAKCRLGRMMRGLHPGSDRAPGVVLHIE